MNLLLKAVSSVTDWHGLGRRLGLTMSELREIEITYHIHGVKRMKAEMFDVWLKNSPNASWADLAAAVKDRDTVTSDIADSPPGNKINVEHNTLEF